MHSFFLIGALIHATLIATIAFFILFAAGKASGFTRTLGTILGYWVLIIALLALAAGVCAQMNGGKPFGMEPMWGHGKHCDADKDDAAAPAATAPAATAPTATAPAATPKKP